MWPERSCATAVAPGGVNYMHDTCGGTQNQSEIIVNPAQPYIAGSFDARAHELSAGDFAELECYRYRSSWKSAGERNRNHAQQRGPTLAEYSFGKGWVVD